MDIFGKYAEVYDALYEDKNYKNESKEIYNLLNKYSNEKDILMLGCGTGKHDRELVTYGYQINGIDISPEMIKKAEEKKGELPITYEVSDIRSYKCNKKYSVILSLFHVISYQSSNNYLIETFRTVADALKKGGYFVFDVWYGPGVLNDLPSVRVKKIETDQYLITRIANPIMHINENLVDVNYEILVENKKTNIVQTFKEKHVMRYLFTPEIEYYLSNCGLELVDCLDCKSLKKPTLDSWTAYFIVKKK